MTLFVFDIETIPDVECARKLLSLEQFSDADVFEAIKAKRRDESGNEFLQHFMHKIVAISIVMRDKDTFKVWSIGEEDSSEKEIIERFFKGVDKYTPTLISWNGTAFDLPVLHYRALYHGITSLKYWDMGERDQNFKWNNYLNRYHTRHIDLMDVLSGYQGKASASLDKVATMLGFPGKFGLDGSKVLDTYLEGNIRQIRDYCETDVLNTYLVYCRYELIKGALSQNQYEQTLNDVKNYLENSGKAHLIDFLQVWNEQ